MTLIALMQVRYTEFILNEVKYKNKNEKRLFQTKDNFYVILTFNDYKSTLTHIVMNVKIIDLNTSCSNKCFFVSYKIDIL